MNSWDKGVMHGKAGTIQHQTKVFCFVALSLPSYLDRLCCKTITQTNKPVNYVQRYQSRFCHLYIFIRNWSISMDDVLHGNMEEDKS